MMTGAPRIFVSAGEPSGDQHAAPVVAALRRRWPGATIEALGGPAMAAAGAIIRFPMERYTALGFVEVVGKLVPHLQLLRGLRADLQARRYDLVLLVDYPGFNLRLADAAHRAAVPTLYYIAPQLWAWRKGRARQLAAAVDRLAVILPFEEAFFASLKVPATFVGHPLAERAWPSREAARCALGLSTTDRVLALFPGSRTQEVQRLWPVFRDTARQLQAAGRCDRIVVAAAPAGSYPGAEGMQCLPGQSAEVLAAADAALVKSGTTTLEAAMCGTPCVVAYRVAPLTAAIARRVVQVPWVSLVNLVADAPVMPEVLQDDVRVERLVAELGPLLDATSEASQRQRAGLATVRERLGGAGASERVAVMAAELLGR